MSIDNSLNVNSSLAQLTGEIRQAGQPNVQELTCLALQGLVPMLDLEKQLFCHRLVRTERGIIQEGISPRYTIMTLLGLRKLEEAGAHLPIDITSVYEALAHDTKWIRGAGDLGLMIWLTATFAPDQLKTFFGRFDLDTALDRYADARQGRTMELSWFLAGLAHSALAQPEILPDLIDLASEAYHRLEANQGERGFFGHMSRKKSVKGFLRGRIGSFADQIYPIYAISKFATAFSIKEPLKAAEDCAMAICSAQGELGQWWWLYESHAGRVASRYPVYSVHQHGMAPMGLFALEEATGQSFDEFIYKGLRWIYGSNELSEDMRDRSESLVWRCILPKNKGTKYRDTLMSFFRTPVLDPAGTDNGPFEILFEERPYESGWLLYAFAGRVQRQADLESPESAGR
jgi:hypothetical protein